MKSLAAVRHLPLPAAGSADQRGSKRENRGAGQLVGVAKVAQFYAMFLCSLDVAYQVRQSTINYYIVGSTLLYCAIILCSLDQGCIFFPKIEFFINHYLEHRVFFINNNGQFFIKRGSFL